MSDKKKYLAADAIKIAKELVEELRPFTIETPEAMKPHWPHSHLLAVAGSLRRRKSEVGDIEILYVPQVVAEMLDMFTVSQIDSLHKRADQLLASKVLAQRPNVKGAFTWGPKNKLAIHVASGIPVDLFATTADNWWVSLVIRTGSKETNLKLTMGAQKQGARLNAYGSGVTWSDGTTTPATSEEHVFEMCGVPFLPPHKR